MISTIASHHQQLISRRQPTTDNDNDNDNNNNDNARECGTSETSFVVRRSAWRHMTSAAAADGDDDDDDDVADRSRCWSTGWTGQDTEWAGRNERPLPMTSVTSPWPWGQGSRDSRSFYLPISAAYINIYSQT